ncbi:MAG: exopolysaccharide Pel transporter PelG [Kiritimatiellia bacterium]
MFLTTLHNDRSVAITFIVGCLTSCAAGLALGPRYSTAGMLLGYNIGLGLVFFTLLARVLAEYPAALASPFAFARTFRKHWLLAAGGLAYNVAIWADKWVMWSAPEAVRHPCGLVSFTNYDSAMFLAFLSIIPAISLFVTNVETRFYEIYLRYLRNIREHAPWSVLERDQRDILATIFSGARQILVWQGLVTAGLLLIAPRLLEMSGIAFIQLGMFRLGLLGAFFHAQFLFLLILLSYFELYRETVLLQLLFLATNTLFTRLTLELGLPWYGCGYAMAAVLSFAAAAAAAFRLLPGVAFETFIRRNAALCASGFDDTASPEDDRRRSASPTGG